jgi:hypothetical protein
MEFVRDVFVLFLLAFNLMPTINDKLIPASLFAPVRLCLFAIIQNLTSQFAKLMQIVHNVVDEKQKMTSQSHHKQNSTTFTYQLLTQTYLYILKY